MSPPGPRLGRRAWLAAVAALAVAPRARAMGRTPTGGRVALSLPWPVASIDPHDLLDPAAALFAAAIADPLFALDASGEPFPSLAAAAPEPVRGGHVVRLRPGLRTARGRALDARDVVFSIARARRGGAAALLAEIPVPEPVRGEPLAVRFATGDVPRLARALASPLAALLPRGFAPERPDGTGALLAEPGAARLVLARSPNAARGPAFLDEIVVEHAADLGAPLRAFESGAVDVGWLGAGLHAPRPGAVRFDHGSAGWIVLRAGREAGGWGAPGVVQRLADALPAERLQQLGLGVRPPAAGEPAWGGPPGAILVHEGATQLVEVARVLASILGRPDHELSVQPVPAAELARRRSSGAFALLLDVVRPLGAPGLATLLALATADDRAAAIALARRPPRLASFAPRAVTRGLRLGVVGELRVFGAAAPDVKLAASPAGEGWDLGASFRARAAAVPG